MLKKTVNTEQTVTIGEQTIYPGQRAAVELPIGALYTRTPIHLPVHVVNGKTEGPRLFVSAAIHGDELNGVEIIRRLLRHKALKELRGILIGIPIVNIFGLVQHSRYLPDRRDLNRSFPGSKEGPLASRLAYIFLESIVKQCTHGIDLHTGASHRCNLPQIRGNLDDPKIRELAKAFGVPILIHSNGRDGSLREAADNHGITAMLYEAGEALRFDELSIRAGVRGILNVMRHLDMLPPKKVKAGDNPEKKKRKKNNEPYTARSTSWVRASHSGILRSLKKLGDKVEKGSLLATIADPTNMFDEEHYEIKAPVAGLIIGRTNLPLVNEGDAVYHIARFGDVIEPADVAAEVEMFQQEILPV